jgi:hypothetical protein
VEKAMIRARGNFWQIGAATGFIGEGLDRRMVLLRYSSICHAIASCSPFFLG